MNISRKLDSMKAGNFIIIEKPLNRVDVNITSVWYRFDY